MAELNFEQLQARSVNRMELASEASIDGRKDEAARHTADAQTFALLSAGAALRELAQAIRQGK